MKKCLGRFLIVTLCLAHISTGCANSNPTEEYANKNEFRYNKEAVSNKLSMIAAGDVLIHGSIYRDAFISGNSYNFTKMLPSVKALIAKYDLKFYNQETVIGGKNLGVSTYPRFNSPDEIADAMVDAGFNMVSLANNHTLDRGERAVMYSAKEYWPTKPVMTSGSYGSSESRNAIQIKEVNGIKCTLLSYTTFSNEIEAGAGKEYLVNIYTPDKVKEDIERARPHADAIIVSMHWGEEYTHTPANSQKEIAKYLASLEVNVVIGHHPHVIQPIEFIGDTLVLYSLGNLLSGQIGIEKLIGAMVAYDIVKDGKGKIKIENVEAHLLYTYYNKFKNYYVYPFAELSNAILPNYASLYSTYSKILKRYDYKNIITIAPLL